MGTPALAIPVLKALLNTVEEVVGVYTQPDRPKGRGQVKEPSPIKEVALTKHLHVLQPLSLQSPHIHQELAALAPDLVVVAAYGKIIPPELLSIPPHGFLNIHPSLLPRYRGPSPVVTAILDGAGATGVSLMLMDEGMDSGSLLAQRRVLIQSRETAQALTLRLFRLGGELLAETLPLWIRGQIECQPQDLGQATYTKKIVKKDGEVRWEMTAEELDRRHRAFIPWPGLYTYWRGRMLKILGALALEEDVPGDAGLVVPVNQRVIEVGVTTAKGIFGLEALQLEGRRAVSAQEFLRGYPEFLGSRLPS